MNVQPSWRGLQPWLWGMQLVRWNCLVGDLRFDLQEAGASAEEVVVILVKFHRGFDFEFHLGCEKTNAGKYELLGYRMLWNTHHIFEFHEKPMPAPIVVHPWMGRVTRINRRWNTKLSVVFFHHFESSSLDESFFKVGILSGIKTKAEICHIPCIIQMRIDVESRSLAGNSNNFGYLERSTSHEPCQARSGRWPLFGWRGGRASLRRHGPKMSQVETKIDQTCRRLYQIV